MSNLEKHLKEVKQKRQRVTDLKNSIEEREKKLPYLRKEYKDAVANDSENVDDLFHEMDSLESELRADKHKLDTLKEVTEDHLRKSAMQVLGSFHEVKPNYEQRGKELKEKYYETLKRHKEEMSSISKEIAEINNDYMDEALKYESLIDDHAIKRVLKPKHPHATGMRPDLDKEHRKEVEKAEKEGQLINRKVYNKIKRATEGNDHVVSLKGEMMYE